MKEITGVAAGSIGEELGLEKGDCIFSINGTEIKDVFDYRFLTADEFLTVTIKTKDDEMVIVNIEKDMDEDLGLSFERGLMDKPLSCHNKCIFCFIDQLPKNEKKLRQTLYFKDDDTRLSFLTGNYVTLTNVSDKELDRIILYRFSRLNISIHAVDDEIWKKIVRPQGGTGTSVLTKIEKLANAGIELNFQIVLCNGINDKHILDETISVLSEFIPQARSLSVVPAGMTKFREENHLFHLEPFSMDESAIVIAQVQYWQKRLRAEKGTFFVFAADEFYISASLPIPPHTFYEDFPQLENGVGMLALTEYEFTETLCSIPYYSQKPRTVSVITGTAAYEFICGLATRLMEKAKTITINVIPVKNDFFGETITVSGLLTGRDILNTCLEKKELLGEKILIPQNCLKDGEDIFLDDETPQGISEKIGVPVVPVPTDGESFVKACLQ
ncbi:MAG: DUF512 domain-containing protein [Clostridiales bacterium]|nr:DUF512 domain-containing protein [Clostridiales bacterium]